MYYDELTFKPNESQKPDTTLFIDNFDIIKINGKICYSVKKRIKHDHNIIDDVVRPLYIYLKYKCYKRLKYIKTMSINDWLDVMDMFFPTF